MDAVGSKEVELGQSDLDGKTTSEAIGGDTSNTTNMLGDVQTEFIEDLDLVIIKGAQRDVERTLEVIDNIKGKENAVEEGIAKAEANVERDADAAPNVPVVQQSELRDKIRALQQASLRHRDLVAVDNIN